MLSALSLHKTPESLPNMNLRVKQPPLNIAQVLKKLRVVPAPFPPHNLDDTAPSDQPGPKPIDKVVPVLREHALHAAHLNEEHDAKKGHHRPRKPDSAWFFSHGQEKYAHLLRDPVCICGVNVDENSIKCQDGEISLIIDSHPAIEANRWRIGDPVARLIPDELERRVKFGVPPAKLEHDEHKVVVASHATHKIQLPRLHPAGARQMKHTVQAVDEVVDKWQRGSSDFSEDVVGVPSPMLRLVATVYEEQCLYNAVFFEAIRQCTVHCAERGQFLADIRRNYVALLHSTPNYMKDAHHELLVQRSLDRRLLEYYIGYKGWWDAMEFQFDTIKQKSIIGRTVERRYEPIPASPRLGFLLDDESQLFKGYAKLFETQRACLQLDQDDMEFERELWQDLTHLLATELMTSPSYNEFRQLHDVQTTWLAVAKTEYQEVALQDQQQVLALREQTKVWLGTLAHLEKRLADNERAVFETLTETREEIEETVRRFFDREGPVEADLQQDITDAMRRWIKNLNAVLGRFQAAQAQQNVTVADKVQTAFETLVVNTILALVGRHEREAAVASGPVAPTDESQSTRILEAMDGNNSATIGTVSAVKNSEVAEQEKLELQLGHRLPTLQLPQKVFYESYEVFADLLHRKRAFEADLEVLRDSQPYCQLFNLWQRYQAIQPTFHERIFGNSGLPIAIAHLEEEMEQTCDMAMNPRSNYFSELDPGRFASAGFGFIHLIDQILHTVKLNFNISPLFAEPKDNLIRELIQNARTWFLFCESELEAMTHGILDKISDYSEKMLRIGISLMVTELPDQEFDEERYMRLYKKRADLTMTDKLDLMELQITALVRELENFSRALDERSVGDLSSKEGNQTEGSLRETFSTVTEWHSIAAKLLQIAYEINAIDKASQEGTALSRYKQKLKDAKTQISQHQFKLQELMDLVNRHVDKLDFVEIPVLGDEINIYVKPFCIATMENVNREVDCCTTEYTDHMTVELAAQRDLNAVTQQRIRDLEEGLTKAKEVNRTLSSVAESLREEQTISVPVLPKYTDETMEIIQLMGDEQEPEVMRPGLYPPVMEQQTLLHWDILMDSAGPESVFARVERPLFNFAGQMSDMAEYLRPKILNRLQERQGIEPALEPDVEKQEYFRQRKADRDKARADRWENCEKLRQERYKVHVAS